LIVIGLYSVLWGKHKEEVENNNNNKVVENIPLPLKGAMVEANNNPDSSNNISSLIINVTTEPPFKSNS